jgi:hypothetical protein
MTQIKIAGFIITCILLLTGDAVQGQNTITKSVIGNAAVHMTGADYQLQGTVGQPLIDMSTITSYRMHFGFWYIQQVVVDVEDLMALMPIEFELFQNYPNPFNAVTTIRYAVPKPADVKIELYNLLGQRVAVLLAAPKQPGYHELQYNAGHLASGLYFYRFQSEGYHFVKKMILAK